MQQGLFISADTHASSRGLAQCLSYYDSSRAVAQHIEAYLLAVFPQWAKDYRSCFDAGRLLPQDPGPFLGRAIIYKLQGEVHKDCRDAGPSASFGVGYYDGGNMLVPQLGAKFLWVYNFSSACMSTHTIYYCQSYDPGAICIFFSSSMWHKVSQFRSHIQTQDQLQKSIIPGRIGTVFFFPKASLELLNRKETGWGLSTAFGAKESVDARAQNLGDELGDELMQLAEEVSENTMDTS